jgi:hypothetical protein
MKPFASAVSLAVLIGDGDKWAHHYRPDGQDSAYWTRLVSLCVANGPAWAEEIHARQDILDGVAKTVSMRERCLRSYEKHA